MQAEAAPSAIQDVEGSGELAAAEMPVQEPPWDAEAVPAPTSEYDSQAEPIVAGTHDLEQADGLEFGVDVMGDVRGEPEASAALAEPLTMTTQVYADQPEVESGPIAEPVGQGEEIVAPPMEEPVPEIELAVSRAELPAEAMESLSASTDVLAIEPTGPAAEAVGSSIETQEPVALLPREAAQIEGIAAADVPLPALSGRGQRSDYGEDASLAEQSGEEAGMFGFVPRRESVATRLSPGARTGSSATAEAGRVVPRTVGRRRRSQGGSIAGLVGVMLSGLLGMALVYYAFNLLGGPKWDVLKFPLPGVRHTYKHLLKYPSLPRFGIDPEAVTAKPGKGGPAAAPDASERGSEPAEAVVEPTSDAAEPTEKATEPAAKPAAPAKKAVGTARKSQGPARPDAKPPKKPKDDDSPFDMPAPDPAENLPSPVLPNPGST